jgi:2-polyprenyl-3-methyl-5-hydroxy-6-metoxy-1,4-benzoquinol methylase
MKIYCRICHSEKLKFKFLTAGEDLDECTNCGFVQVRKEPTEDALRKIYSATYFAHAKYQDQQAVSFEHRRRLALLSSFLSKGEKVLDAGCSVGDFIACAKRNYEIYGLDISPSAISQAKNNNPELAERLFTVGLENSFFPDQRFRAICLWDVIEHLWDPAKVVKRLLSLLEPNGYLFISTPAIDAPIAKLLGRYWAFMTPPEHLSFFSSKSLHLLFEAQEKSAVLHFARKGKWANLAFIGYKIGRILPMTVPKWLLKPFNLPVLRHINIYVPTSDIQYLVVKRSS